MEALFLSLIAITALFFLFLIIRNIFNSKNMCAICASVFLTWIVLLSLYFSNIFPDKTIIAILMGQTSLGLFYLFYEKLNIFKIPFLLTLITLVYFVLEKFSLDSIYFLTALWAFFFIIYLFKSNKKINVFANKMIERCKKW